MKHVAFAEITTRSENFVLAVAHRGPDGKAQIDLLERLPFDQTILLARKKNTDTE